MKPVIPQVTPDTWRALYAAAEAFRKLEPWNHLLDDDLFGVRDPKTGQIFYCCVLGARGEALGLCAYRGAEGFEAWDEINSGMSTPEDDDFDDVVVRQNLLVVEFVNKAGMKPPDAKILKHLGIIPPKGRKKHPIFRSCIPNCPPWYINEDEALAMIAVLHCARIFATEHKTNPLSVEKNFDGLLVYFPPLDFAAAVSIPTRREQPEAPPNAPLPMVKVDRFSINRLKTAKPSHELIWEADCFVNPAVTVSDRERPYWMRVVIIAAHASGFILNMNGIANDDDPHIAIADVLMAAIENHGQKPSELHVRDVLTMVALTPLAGDLNISVKVKERLTAMIDIKDALKEGFPHH